MPRPASTRFVVYGLLFTLGSLFATPFVWLVLTALKPVEQTTKFPPVFIPRAYHAELDGRSVEVTKDYVLTQDAVIVEAAGLRHVVSLAQFDEAAGTARLAPDAPPLPARLLRRVQAGDWRVTERAEGFGRAGSLAWDIVPESAIDARVKPRWENFSLAIATIGGRSVEEVQGTVSTVHSHGADSEVTFWDFLTNTLLVCVLGTIGAVLSNALIAYGFARLQWPGRDLLFAITLGTMMVPFPVLMVPLYGVFKELGWIGTLLPLWVPAWFGSAFNIFLMRQFFRTIPEDLSEAARIDGCSEWQIFWKVILPLSKPVLAVVALFHFLHTWNDFMGPLLYLTKRSTFTLAVALQNYQTQNGGTPWHFLMAASTIVIVPVILLFFFTQKTFIRGIATTGMKG
ncbi:carbohydrate ABC transporter permease [Oleiharenicola lentus]|uniref:Carbohydrate ABC transporter permease n=1 Tax=Oleiharenicola lentus TaxID=2508720 RepID=A0A4Q1CBQ8_9BACT|nr:carbohydrate ABC transporter permease [Oleiharenicola lentus]RXK56361.1 carbohydrate ABC transporter permease [Oleiharenicola lentus]